MGLIYRAVNFRSAPKVVDSGTAIRRPIKRPRISGQQRCPHVYRPRLRAFAKDRHRRVSRAPDEANPRRDSSQTEPRRPRPAEAAFLAAIAVAQRQKARSFELRAALSLAKLHKATGRPIDVHDALWPAVEGFSATPDFPAIAEALKFVAAIKATGEQS